MKNYEMEINQFIEKNLASIYRHLDDIIRVRSISEESHSYKPFGKGCRDVADKMMKIGEGLGFRVENHDYYGVSLLMGTQEDEIALLTHLDVVAEGEGWEVPPYELTRKEGLLYGRGVLDDKGPTLMALYAMQFLKEQKVGLNYSFRLFMGCSEERDMSCIDYYVRNVKQPVFAFSPDNKFPVCAGEKGIIDFGIKMDCPKEITEIKGGDALNIVAAWCDVVLEPSITMKATSHDYNEVQVCENSLKVKGKSAHGGTPQEGINAIEVAFRYMRDSYQLSDESKVLVDQIIELCDLKGEGFGIAKYKDESGEVTSSLGLIHLEDGQLHLGFNIRYPVKASSEDVQGDLLSKTKSMGIMVTKNIDHKPVYVDVESNEIRLLTKAIELVTGEKQTPYYSSGGTYARKLDNAVAYGPELTPKDFGAPHTSNECMYEKDFITGMKVYMHSLLMLNESSIEP